MTFQMTWPQRHVELLVQHYNAKHSMSEIADMLNQLFHTQYTRNSVAGVLSRMVKNNVIKHRPPNPGDTGTRRTARRRQASTTPTPQPAMRTTQTMGLVMRPELVEERVKSDTPQPGCDIYSLNGNSCRYPFGDVAPYIYCGEATLGETSWCREHYKIVHEPSRSFKRHVVA